METGLRGWNELGIVGTIYEEEEEDDDDADSTIPSVPSQESTPSPVLSFSTLRKPRSSGRVNQQPDVVILVQESCFRLHKRSGCLKRQLDKLTEVTLNPPLNITAETFALVTDFSYGAHIAITPFNVAALRTAAELLEMTEVCGPWDENLRQKTEAYFCRVVAVDKEYASVVLRSCFPLLPEAETAAALVSRCIEALSLIGEGEWLGDVTRLRAEDLQLVLESMSQRCIESHDLLYTIIDLYIKDQKDRTVSEEQKTRMCNYIDCSILSHRLLMHAVQNPRMPLRFVVQAMFVEQLNTRRSILSNKTHQPKDPVTLGAILKRDAAFRQVNQLKNVMTATNSRIQSLEKELSGMRKLLTDVENMSIINSGRSASFRFSSEGNKVARGQIGSISASSVRNVGSRIGAEGSSSSEESSEGARSVEKNLGRRLIHGLKSAFRLQSFVSKRCDTKGYQNVENSGNEDRGNEEIVIIRKDQAFHRRTRSNSSV
ncbi:BTB/POZ domain-containing protein-like [Dorcoceras hygrometricum]|uniref:BTB/POZ domain-containing protein-like n=1 Tax=Dorcoceras hygrometricum TaxID=472368 RepID=A0A2Z7DCV6_9LAMI|nr:BTB/POZ domain-containing protein-like [Dorcoceras hygrometricum]